MPGKYFKGALISFMPTFVTPLPNVIVFQYNPETIAHNWTAPAAAGGGGGKDKPGEDPFAVAGLPGETFSFTLTLDANDSIADGNVVSSSLASLSGVYPRLAALEMLQYPSGAFSGGLLGTVSTAITSALSSVTGSSGASKAAVPRNDVPVVLFVWGPQRIVPVRVTSLNITEKLYDTLLNPTHADVQLSLRVLTPDEVNHVDGQMKTIAQAAYVYSQGLRQVQAVANLGDAAASIIGMLPNPF